MNTYAITSMDSAKIKLASADAAMFLLIMYYPTAYNRWCKSNDIAGGSDTVSLPIQIIETF